MFIWLSFTQPVVCSNVTFSFPQLTVNTNGIWTFGYQQMSAVMLPTSQQWCFKSLNYIHITNFMLIIWRLYHIITLFYKRYNIKELLIITSNIIKWKVIIHTTAKKRSFWPLIINTLDLNKSIWLKYQV